MVKESESEKAKEKIIEQLRGLYSCKLTLPLGNPNLRLVHTNQFLFTELPSGVFDLDNFEEIAKALNSTYSRYSGYTLNRWYIEGITINNDGDKATMELDLNPFASTLLKFRDDRNSFTKAYTDAFEKNKSSSNSSNVKSVKNSSNCPGGEGKTIDNQVKKIVGKATDPLKKAKLIHEWLIKNVSYQYHYGCKYCTPEKAYKNRSHIACADTSILTRSMMVSAGLDAWIVHGGSGKTAHYWTQIKINGKTYNSDATSHKRKWNQVWLNLKVNRKCGKKPC